MLRQTREICLYTRSFPHRVGGLPTVPTDLPPAKTRIPSTPRPQAIHSTSTSLSTLIPQVAHTLCTGGGDHSEEGFGPFCPPPETVPNLGTTMGTTRRICGRIRGRPKPSTDAPGYPQVRHHGYPHAREPSDLRERARSTQSTTPTTAAAFRSLLREKKIKTGGGRSWGQLRDRVVMSTKSRGGRGDGGARDGLTWTPAPGPRSGRSRGGRTGRRGQPVTVLREEAWPEPAGGSIVERMRA